MKRIFGAFALLFGSVTLLWIGYNMLIEMRPEVEGRNPIAGIGFSVVMIYVGYMWVQGKQAG